jgi:hypothetical protein
MECYDVIEEGNTWCGFSCGEFADEEPWISLSELEQGEDTTPAEARHEPRRRTQVWIHHMDVYVSPWRLRE